MKPQFLFSSAAALALSGTLACAENLSYDFAADAQGFAGVSWSAASPTGWGGLPGTVQQTHAAGGWQMVMTKEFAWGAGGGSANQQLAMRELANLGTSRISFDLMVDGASFPPGAATWFQASLVGNSDGAASWTQISDIFTAASWHNADDPTLVSKHFDYAFSQLGWQPGDTWFQFWTGSNSADAVPVNFYIDNVMAYAIPEPTAATILGLGALAGLLLRRRR
jgi:hypothetical protein